MKQITCLLCGKKFQKITNTHLERVHPGWSTNRYKEEFGEKSLMSDDWRWLMSNIVSQNVEERTVKSSTTKREKMSEVATSFTEVEEQIVLGGLFGDSWLFQPQQVLYPPRGVGATYLSMQHKLTQLPYLTWKARMLERFKPVLYQRFHFNTVKSRFDVSHQVDTMSHWLFGDLAKDFYPAKEKFQKQLPLDLLQHLQPLGLAVWYQDDGMYNKSASNCQFATDCFTRESVDNAASILTNRFGIHFSAHHYKTGVTRIAIPKSETPSFIKLIKEYMHPCLLYKVNVFDVQKAIVARSFEIDYGHYLHDYEGKCSTSHGHRLRVEVALRGPINPDTGFVADFGDLKKVVQPILDAFDHKVLNEVLPTLSVNATVEAFVIYLVVVLKKYLPNLLYVKAWETPDCWFQLEVEENDSERLEDFLDKMAEVGEWWHEIKTIKSSVFSNTEVPRGKEREAS